MSKKNYLDKRYCFPYLANCLQAQMNELPKELSEIEKGANSCEVPQEYFNGFVNQVTNGDVMIALFRNGKNTMVLNASYTVAKSLAEKLGQLVSDFETRMGIVVVTPDDVNKRLEG